MTAYETFILLKPDALERNLVGEILLRFERKGFKISRISSCIASKTLVEQHYVEHVGKFFFGGLVQSLEGKSVICIVLAGGDEHLVPVVRKMLGAADPLQREPGTIRGDLAGGKTSNLVHASDSYEAARREISLWFQ
jgi:nucleoside-diphosphate kinase